MSHSIILLDVEGTTTPITFVKDTLFPYITANVHTYLQNTYTQQQTQQDVEALIQHSRQTDHELDNIDLNSHNDSTIQQLASYVQSLVQKDIKCTPLKQLQGHMWLTGYANGDYRGAMYDDVAPAFRRWTEQNKHVFIYSSGSITAQKLIFHYSTAGDLTSYISGHFDTTSGHKQEQQSYVTIVDAIKSKHSTSMSDIRDILFCTDVYNEAVAADAAGIDVLLMLRPGNAPLPTDNKFNTAHSFDKVN